MYRILHSKLKSSHIRVYESYPPTSAGASDWQNNQAFVHIVTNLVYTCQLYRKFKKIVITFLNHQCLFVEVEKNDRITKYISNNEMGFKSLKFNQWIWFNKLVNVEPNFGFSGSRGPKGPCESDKERKALRRVHIISSL